MRLTPKQPIHPHDQIHLDKFMQYYHPEHRLEGFRPDMIRILASEWDEATYRISVIPRKRDQRPWHILLDQISRHADLLGSGADIEVRLLAEAERWFRNHWYLFDDEETTTVYPPRTAGLMFT